MTKELKKDSHNISKRAILSCVVIAAVSISNCTMAKALDINNSMVTTSSINTNLNEGYKFLIDSPLKSYNDINKVEKVAGFKFKVPDFIPTGYRLATYQMSKISDNDNGVQIYFDNTNKEVDDITFQVSKKDPIEALKKIESQKISTNSKVETEEKSMKLGEINGKSITLTITEPAKKMEDGNMKEEFKEIDKYFVWENEGLCYSIKYNSAYKTGNKLGKLKVELSEDNIGKIAKSIKYPAEVKGVSYAVPKQELSTEIGVMNIYDKEDLESAKKLLGFNPKLPIKINESISINDSGVGISYDSDIKNNKINYELNSFYSNKNGSITFWEGKTSKEYDDIKKNGYYNQDIGENKEPKKIKGEKLNINNKEVFKEDEKAQGQGSDVSYIWKEDNVYYSVTFFRETENSDEIVKDFVNSKPID